VELKLFVATRWVKSGALDHIPATAFDGYPKLTRLTEAVAEHPGVRSWYAKG
jgi:hypothetical protein